MANGSKSPARTIKKPLQSGELVLNTTRVHGVIYLVSTQNPFTPQASLEFVRELERIHKNYKVGALSCQLTECSQHLLDERTKIKRKFEPEEIKFSHPINYAMAEGIKVYAIDSKELLLLEQLSIERVITPNADAYALSYLAKQEEDRAHYTSMRIKEILRKNSPLVHICSIGQSARIRNFFM